MNKVMLRNCSMHVLATLLLVGFCKQVTGVSFGSTGTLVIFSSQIVASNGDIIECGSALEKGLAVTSGIVNYRSCMPLKDAFALNGYMLNLDTADLVFGENSTIQSWGTITGNNHKVVLGAQSSIWTTSPTFVDTHLFFNAAKTSINTTVCFSGNCTLNGGGNTLEFLNGSIIEVKSGSTLCISNVFIKGLGDSNGGKFVVADDAQIQFSNVTFELNGNVLTTDGTYKFKGPAMVFLKHNIWSFKSGSSLIVDGVTIWKDIASEYDSPGNIKTANGVMSLYNYGCIKYIYGGTHGDYNSILEELIKCCLEESAESPCDKFINAGNEELCIINNLVPQEDQTYAFVLDGTTVLIDGEKISSIALERNARMVFTGQGTVVLKNNVFVNASLGHFLLLDDVSLVVQDSSQLINEPEQVRFDLFKSIARKIKSHLIDDMW